MLNKNIYLVIIFFFLSSCFEYEHTNPFDPDYSGERTKNISIFSFIIDDNNQNANNNSEINPGEKIKINVAVQNIGNSIAKNVSAEVNSNNSNIIVLPDPFEYLNWGDIFPDSTSDGKGGLSVAEASVEIEVNENTLDNEKFTLIFDFKDDENNTWLDSLSFVVKVLGNILSITNVDITERTSDISYRYFYFKPYIFNKSTASVLNVSGKLSENDLDVEIVFGDEKPFGDIAPGDTSTTTYPYDFEIRIPKSLTIPHSALFYLELSDNLGTVWNDSINVSIQ